MKHVRELPAVIEAASSSGIFSVAANHSWLHPNKGAAKRVLFDGRLPTDRIRFFQMARELSPYEKEVYYYARHQIRNTLDFKGVKVLDNTKPVMVTFGDYLLLSPQLLLENNFVCMLAHELGHLENGDSFVRAAIWLLGKGFAHEHVTPFNVDHDPDERRKEFAEGAWDVGTALGRWGWVGGAAALGGKMVQNIGSGVLGYEVQINQYFQKWDIEAGAKAEKWVGVDEYQGYLSDLMKDEYRAMFDAAPSIRLEASEIRQRPDYKAVKIPAAVTGNTRPLWQTLLLVLVFGVFGFIGLEIVVFLMIAPFW